MKDEVMTVTEDESCPKSCKFGQFDKLFDHLGFDFLLSENFDSKMSFFEALDDFKQTTADDESKFMIHMLENSELFSIAKYRYEFVEFVEENLAESLNDVCAYLDTLEIFSANLSLISIDYDVKYEFLVSVQKKFETCTKSVLIKHRSSAMVAQ